MAPWSVSSFRHSRVTGPISAAPFWIVTAFLRRVWQGRAQSFHVLESRVRSGFQRCSQQNCAQRVVAEGVGFGSPPPLDCA